MIVTWASVLCHKEIIEFLIFPGFIGIQALLEVYGTVAAIRPLFVPLVYHAPDYAHSRCHCRYGDIDAAAGLLLKCLKHASYPLQIPGFLF